MGSTQRNIIRNSKGNNSVGKINQQNTKYIPKKNVMVENPYAKLISLNKKKKK